MYYPVQIIEIYFNDASKTALRFSIPLSQWFNHKPRIVHDVDSL